MENIAIIVGGTSKEKEISLKSGETIYKNIDVLKYNAYKVICIDNSHFEVIIENIRITIDTSDFSFMLKNRKIKFDKIFMMIHGDPGENGKLCPYFDAQRIPYTSCNGQTSLLTFNKFKCNIHLRELGYRVPKSYLHPFKSKELPCIIKPTCSGSSFGISKVSNEKDLHEAIQEAGKHGQEIIMEEFIEGREFTCAVFNILHEINTLPITEIISENEIFDYDAKYNGKSKEETPAQICKTVKDEIEKTAKNIYRDLNLSGLIRIDFIMQKDLLYIIEINTIPGFSENSIVPQMLRCAKINITQFITLQLDNI